ncbi:conserved unknown protein [Ectocarpus siliculosus]|uniref:Uncharacterized protein n=1 Tax=Ectocarpus siliculosus TaxID=2880 RepID=D8LP46_ECTSI|nr:conserved unknown protein [Ectocarpus siliculosus]|eukprot:CBN80317.1 conserved unknown protein [Ectocarpus siliculosus]
MLQCQMRDSAEHPLRQGVLGCCPACLLLPPCSRRLTHHDYHDRVSARWIESGGKPILIVPPRRNGTNPPKGPGKGARRNRRKNGYKRKRARPDARDAVQNLMASLDAAAAENQSGAIEVACQDFRETAFGKEVMHDLHVDGIVNIPYGTSEADALSMAGVVRGAAQDLVLGEKPHRERVKIKGQTRYALEAIYMGGGAVAAFEEIASLLAAVLCAVVDGASGGVVTHKHVALANAMGTGVQMWHRDGRAKEVLAKTNPSHKDNRKRPEPHPFSAVIAFEENTVLHVVRGSHNRGKENDFSQDAPHAHHITIGYAAIPLVLEGDAPAQSPMGEMMQYAAGKGVARIGYIGKTSGRGPLKLAPGLTDAWRTGAVTDKQLRDTLNGGTFTIDNTEENKRTDKTCYATLENDTVTAMIREGTRMGELCFPRRGNHLQYGTLTGKEADGVAWSGSECMLFAKDGGMTNPHVDVQSVPGGTGRIIHMPAAGVIRRVNYVEENRPAKQAIVVHADDMSRVIETLKINTKKESASQYGGPPRTLPEFARVLKSKGIRFVVMNFPSRCSYALPARPSFMRAHELALRGLLHSNDAWWYKDVLRPFSKEANIKCLVNKENARYASSEHGYLSSLQGSGPDKCPWMIGESFLTDGVQIKLLLVTLEHGRKAFSGSSELNEAGYNKLPRADAQLESLLKEGRGVYNISSLLESTSIREDVIVMSADPGQAKVWPALATSAKRLDEGLSH